MALIKSEKDTVILRAGGERLAFVLREVAAKVRAGVTTRELDALAEKLIKEGGDKPSFLNYRPSGERVAFPASLCTSVNDEVVHGIPGDRELRDGDIIGLDLGLEHKGLYTDMAVTVPVGKVDEAATKLMKVTKDALARGIKVMRSGGHIGDIGEAIESFVKPFGYGIVRELGGHGVGHDVHEMPYVPNFGKKGTGMKLEAGMVLAIEPMFNEGAFDVKLSPNKFTYITRDGKRSAHFEHTVLVTEKEAEILTVA